MMVRSATVGQVDHGEGDVGGRWGSMGQGVGKGSGPGFPLGQAGVLPEGDGTCQRTEC